MTQRPHNKILSLALTVLLGLGSMAMGTTTASAAIIYSDGINMNELFAPGNGIYYGAYDHAILFAYDQWGTATHEGTDRPILWRVMGEENSERNVTLLSEYVLDNQQFYSVLAAGSNNYNASAIRDWLNRAFLNSFEDAEQNGMAATDVVTGMYDYSSGTEIIGSHTCKGDSHTYTNSLPWTAASQKVYLPWGKHNDNSAYWTAGNDASDGLLSSNAATLRGGNIGVVYYLRSPSSEYSCDVLAINGSGVSTLSIADYGSGVRPAFKLNPYTVVFASEIKEAPDASKGDTPEDSDNYSAADSAKNFKLTVLSEGGSLTGVPTTGQAIISGNDLTLDNLVAGETGGDYTVNYKIVGTGTGWRGIVGYGSTAATAATNLTLDTDGLVAGRYTAYVWLQKNNTISSHEAMAIKYFGITITETPTYTITGSPTSKDFGSAVVGYDAPTAQIINITNTGNSSVTLTQPASTDYTIGTLSTTTLPTGGTTSFTVTPKTGLAVGAHNETLTISTDHSTSATVKLGFTVTSGTGGGSDTPSIPQATNVITEKQPNMPTTAKTSIPVTVRDGTISANITEQMVKNSIKVAQDAAKKSGKEIDGIALNFNVTGGSYSSLNITIDTGVIDRLKEAGVKFVRIGSSVLDITIDAGAITEIDRQSSGTVTVSASRLTKLSDAAKKLVGNRPVFNITVGYQKNGQTALVSNFGNGAVTLGIAYKSTDKERTGNLFGVYVDKKGKPQLLTNSSYDNGRLIFSRNSLSTYGVGYKAPAPAFADTAKHWAKDNIDFVASRNLISGTTATAFAPNTAITRADFLMALGRLSCADVSIYKTSSFTDVKATDTAMPYIEWAVKSKIVSGYGNGKFGPKDSITREQMAVMMVNYAKVAGYKLPASVAAVTFSDSAKISAYARDAVKAIQQAGIMQGKGSNTLAPQGKATRAEASTILRRFVELVIDEGTARGWVQNDIGQWQYIGENGKPTTGWLTVENGKYHYYFTSDGIMVSGKWLQIEGKWYYFYADGALAKSTKVDGYEIDESGVRKSK